ncbi:MAG: bifunctional 5,10-methylenetetrahydrofolate dehydrogenase/5,10-methenyltetrahydrofolate cyclohydrolase, partial [Paludibacteraceae bacterium]|nr:bifunctional 5,10-methylenetetrahydrofolate dehydrogenase/5,10-methenyltetrahydrofolate cyclohydrolase [Paludibacteraceae bacterium]
MQILDGKKIAEQIKDDIRHECEQIAQTHQRPPTLGIIIVGHNPASETYVNNKIKACEKVGMGVRKIALEATITQEELLQQVQQLNADPTIDGFIVQLPLPEHINEQEITAKIDYRKDVDGLTPENIGRLAKGLPGIVSATPKGILELLHRYNISLEGKMVTVIGRSNIVGRPLSILLSSKRGGSATVTLCHSRTQNLASICRQSQIIIVAVGKPNLITADMVSDDTIIIDVGITRIVTPTSVKIVGDVDFANVAPKCSYITPVPGGVGPMTIVSLLQNTLEA